jgi:hypothetical protein
MLVGRLLMGGAGECYEALQWLVPDEKMLRIWISRWSEMAFSRAHIRFSM